MNCKNCYVEGCTHRPFPNETECIFRQWTAKQFDWQSFRNQAAKDILCVMLVDQRISETTTYKDLVKMSLECTDELIKQLKGKEK